MVFDYEKIKTDLTSEIQGAVSLDVLEILRIKYLGKKGLVKDMQAALATASKEEKRALGQGSNEVKQLAESLIQEVKTKLSSQAEEMDAIDITLPGVGRTIGTHHLLTQTLEEICDVFRSMGFVIQTGPEVESEFNNFTALNIPLDHPSRDSFDTFYLEQDDPDLPGRKMLLRSQTSPVQIRVMKANKPPLAVISPGKVYRPDALDASHSFMFHQIEGLLVDKKVTFADLKGLLTTFCKKFFGEDVKMRFRPHYFPFTEPSAEVDIQSNIFKGKADKWLEILGCGMVHPEVFKHVGYAEGEYTGLAFGLGVERIAMLKHGIGDIRVFTDNDVRFLKQF